MIFTKNLKLKNIYFFTIIFLNVITAPWTLKGSRNIQSFALIRSVLFSFSLHNITWMFLPHDPSHTRMHIPRKILGGKSITLECG